MASLQPVLFVHPKRMRGSGLRPMSGRGLNTMGGGNGLRPMGGGRRMRGGSTSTIGIRPLPTPILRPGPYIPRPFPRIPRIPDNRSFDWIGHERDTAGGMSRAQMELVRRDLQRRHPEMFPKQGGTGKKKAKKSTRRVRRR